MMLFHVSQVRPAEIVVMGRVMHPLLNDIADKPGGNHDRCRIWRKKPDTQRDKRDKKHQHVAKSSAGVVTVKRPFMMLKVHWIEKLVCQIARRLFVPFL